MKALREWSGRRVAVVVLVWLLGLPVLMAPAVFGAVGWLARTERARTVPVPDSAAPALRVTYGPPDSGDFLLSFAGPGVIWVLSVLLLPPLALWLTWLVLRRRQSDQGA